MWKKSFRFTGVKFKSSRTVGGVNVTAFPAKHFWSLQGVYLNLDIIVFKEPFPLLVNFLEKKQ